MNEQDFKIRTRIIRETFNDPRKIKCITPESERKVDNHIHPGGDIFTTESGEYIDLEFQLTNFDEDELTKYIELAEHLYEKHQKRVSIYLICPKYVNVCVKECEIKSEADFNIKLACSQEDPCQIILNGIKHKLSNGITLNEEDIHAVSMLPVMCEKEDRNYYRKEYFKIINNIDY